MSMTRASDMTYQDLFEAFIRHKTMIGLAPATITTYHNNHKYFDEFINAKETLVADMHAGEVLNDYVMYLQMKGGLKPITINTYIRHITPVLKFAVKMKYMEDFRMEYLREEEVIKEIYTEWELKTLLVKPKMKSFAEYRNWVIINFLLGTGVRAKELRNIKIKHLHLEDGICLLAKTKNKKQRYVPMSTTLVGVLEEFLPYRDAEPDSYLFCTIYGEQIPRTTLQYCVSKYAQKRGVSRWSLHLFRHTYATLYITNGGNPLKLKKILGHATMRQVNHYVNLNRKDLVDDIDALSPLEKYADKERLDLQK